MKKLILLVLVLPIFIFAKDKYEYEFSTTLALTDEINANRDTFYPSFAFSLAKNVNLVLFNQVDLSYSKSKKVSYNNSNMSTFINRYSINFYQYKAINKTLDFYPLIGFGFQEFSKKLNVEDSKFINYGLGLKQKIFNKYFLKADARHLIQSSNGEHSFMYNLSFTIPFGNTKKIKRYYYINKKNVDFTPY